MLSLCLKTFKISSIAHAIENSLFSKAFVRREIPACCFIFFCCCRSLTDTPRSGSNLAAGCAKENVHNHSTHHSTNQHSLNPHRSPHGPASKLHGPHNGQEYYAIDNIISDSDFQMAMSQSGPAGLKLGVIIRTWGVNVSP